VEGEKLLGVCSLWGGKETKVFKEVKTSPEERENGQGKKLFGALT